MLVIRLSRTGRTKQPYYRVVVADRRSAVDSGAIEVLGHYNPRTKEVVIDVERAKVRLAQGAQPSETAAMLLEKTGAMKREKITDKNRRPTRAPRKEQPEEAATPAPAEAAATTEQENAEAEAVVEAVVSSDASAEEIAATVDASETPEVAPTEETSSDSAEASSDDESVDKKD